MIEFVVCRLKTGVHRIFDASQAEGPLTKGVCPGYGSSHRGNFGDHHHHLWHVKSDDEPWVMGESHARAMYLSLDIEAWIGDTTRSLVEMSHF